MSLSLVKEWQVPWGVVVPSDVELWSGHTKVVTAAAHMCHSPPPKGHLSTGDTINVPTRRCGIPANVGFADLGTFWPLPSFRSSPEQRLLVLG